MLPPWLRAAERGGRRITRFYSWLCLTFGRRPARPILYGIALYFLLTAGGARRASQDYMTRIGMSRAGWFHAYRHILAFSSVIVDRLFFLARGTDGYDLAIYGREAFDRLLKTNEGFLVASAHFGNFDALRVLGVDHMNLPIKILMYLDNARQMNALFDEINPAIAQTIIPLGKPGAMLEVREWMEHGGIVGILADRIVQGDKLVRTEFLGEGADFPLGPWLLAHALGAPVIVCFAVYRGRARYDVYLEEFNAAERAEGESRLQMAERLATDFAGRLEHHCRDAPYNWFNFYDFWADTRNNGEASRNHA
ncbi:MAG: lipid A biosynthesis acyltransferase [Alphaproteobacteria bacterium]|nr:lipid A biosynthesis acyltransferase [Alphaproteobacteria bacterium]